MSGARLELVVVGLDHTTAAIELRERLAFPGEEIPAALEQLIGPNGALLERARGGRPFLLIDLAVPRDIDPAVATLPGIQLVTIDDLRREVEHALRQRRAELPEARSVLRAEVARFSRWLRRRELSRQRAGSVAAPASSRPAP